MSIRDAATIAALITICAAFVIVACTQGGSNGITEPEAGEPGTVSAFIDGLTGQGDKPPSTGDVPQGTIGQWVFCGNEADLVEPCTTPPPYILDTDKGQECLYKHSINGHEKWRRCRFESAEP